jgi:membrane protease YdiL (CAAX protease family)
MTIERTGPLRAPFVRLFIALAFVVPVLVAHVAIWQLAEVLGSLASAVFSAAVACLGGWAAYEAYVRRFERRAVTEFAIAGARRELTAGLVLGASLFAATIGVLAIAGVYRVAGTGPLAAVVLTLLLSIAAGTIEEIVFRGVVFRILEEWGGTSVALAASALLFGALHWVNPQATVLGIVGIVFLGGVLLAAAYVLTRRLWLPIGIHVGWNFAEGGIFGVPTSGVRTPGVLQGELVGPEWLSGGSFGPEASVVAIVLCVAVGIALLVLAGRRGRFVAPRSRGASPATPAS